MTGADVWGEAVDLAWVLAGFSVTLALPLLFVSLLLSLRVAGRV